MEAVKARSHERCKSSPTDYFGENMTKYCENEELRNWSLGHNVCDGDPQKCKRLIKFGKQEYCGFCPSHCALHQIIKGQAGCIFCKYYSKDIDSKKCLECLSNEKRINWQKCDSCPDWYTLE